MKNKEEWLIGQLISTGLLIISGAIIVKLAKSAEEPVVMLYGLYLIIGSLLALIIEVLSS